MQTAPLDSHQPQDFKPNDSLQSDDSSEMDLDPASLDAILRTIRASPFDNPAECSEQRAKNEPGMSKCLCSACIYTGQETFDTSFSGRNTGEDTCLRNAYEKLLADHKRVVQEAAELRSLNRGLMQDKIQLSVSLKNSQQQLGVLLRSCNVQSEGRCCLSNSDANAQLKQLKAKSEQRLNFCYKKLEQYIVKAEHQESTIDDLQFKLKQTVKDCERRIHELTSKVMHTARGSARLNATDSQIKNIADTSLIAETRNFREKRQLLFKNRDCNKLLIDHNASFDNLFIDFDAGKGFDYPGNSQSHAMDMTYA